MLKIATILPYKENYTFKKAAAASLWVSDFYKYSKYKKTNYIFGNTNTKDYLSKNYINIPINKNSKFSSSTKEYCNFLIKKIKNRKFDIVEVHNRPQVFTYLEDKMKSKYIIYFHNDPLSMGGSKTVKERLNLVKKANKIIFITKWVQKRFFKDLDEKLINKTEIVYHSIARDKKIHKKDKKITFVGKLNKSKGYDIYGNAITKILTEFKDWKAYSIGDEKRNKPIFEHERHYDLGYRSHKYVLKFLQKSEIAIILIF